jgi:hypothetical protein
MPRRGYASCPRGRGNDDLARPSATFVDNARTRTRPSVICSWSVLRGCPRGAIRRVMRYQRDVLVDLRIRGCRRGTKICRRHRGRRCRDDFSIVSQIMKHDDDDDGCQDDRRDESDDHFLAR